MLRNRLALIGLLAAGLFAMGVVAGVFLLRWTRLAATPKVYNSATLLQRVKTLSELVTVQYVIEKVVVVEDVKWIAGLGENRVLMIAHGVVKAGLDLSRLRPGDLQVSEKRVIINLPPPEITESFLDETQTRVVERSTGFLRSFDKNLEQTARQNALQDIRHAALTGGILKDADSRARSQLTNLFRQLGFEQVEFSR
ncbi:MAG: DUF4230 domain-containing protein [Limisphaerales bacterium]